MKVIYATLAFAAAANAYVLHHGFATFFYQNGGTGSCGQKHRDSEYIVAISAASPFTYNAHCGKTVKITNTGGGQKNYGKGKTIYATVADECRNNDGSKCDPNHLDLSSGAFAALTGGQLDPPGLFNIDWQLQ